MSSEAGKRGHIIVLSGPSGVGKDTVYKRLIAACPELVKSVSATTRAPRAGEVEGKHYFFLTDEQFDRMLAEDAFLEHFEIYGNRYGTPKKFVSDRVAEGKNVVLVIDVQGAARVKELVPDARMIFLMPPKEEVLLSRLHSRNSESEESLKCRLECARSELEQRHRYDHCVVNDDLDRCVEEIVRIVREL